MTVNWNCSSLSFLLFIATVFSIQSSYFVRTGHVCSDPYSCVSTTECAERHSVQGTDEVLFHCGVGQNVCCPPVKSSSDVSPIRQEAPNVYTTTESNNNGDGCSRCAFQQNNPESVNVNSEYPISGPSANVPQGNREHFGVGEYHIHVHEHNFGTGGHHVHENQPSQPRPIQPQNSDSKRPVEPQEARRPPQSQPSQKPQSSQTSSQSQKPQSSKKQQKPQTLQSSQPSPQTQKPQNSQKLTSHRNFKLLPKESNCGVNNFANRITEGEEVSLGEYPWMVLTGIKDRYGNYRWTCGGTLINGWYVLTAAHCLMVDNQEIEYVRLGEHSLTNDTDCYRDICLESPEDIQIAEIIPHEGWNTTTIKNDIALLRLSRNPLLLGKSNIYPICLPVEIEKLNISSNTKYEVAGWGKTDWNADEGSDVLRKASISGVNREECNICKDKKKQQYCPITDTQLCVQGWKAVDVCKGDSGGPLMVTRLNIYQIGITSFKGSEYCGAENIPSIFTKVESYLPWILDHIRQ